MLLYLSLSTAGRLPRRPGSLPARVPPPQDAAPDARHRQRESQVRSRGRALDFCFNVVPGDRIGPFQICGDEDCRKRAENAPRSLAESRCFGGQRTGSLLKLAGKERQRPKVSWCSLCPVEEITGSCCNYNCDLFGLQRH